jgi:hypothetical protein
VEFYTHLTNRTIMRKFHDVADWYSVLTWVLRLERWRQRCLDHSPFQWLYGQADDTTY